MKSHRMTVRLTENEISELEKLKSKMKLRGRSELIREALKDFLQSDQPILRREMQNSLDAWRKELHGVGTNLNQIAWRLNADHPLSNDQITRTLDELKMQFKELAINLKGLKNDFGV